MANTCDLLDQRTYNLHSDGSFRQVSHKLASRTFSAHSQIGTPLTKELNDE
jgi:hypothetical protein